MPNTYKCADCGGTFGLVEDKEWSSEKAKKEYEASFGTLIEANVEIICDDCYKAMEKKIGERHENTN
jgi:DNA-directed RNA polymerase subunit RPC12/RpoP